MTRGCREGVTKNAEDLKCSSGGEEGPVPEVPRLRERTQGRLRKARLPAPSSLVRSAAARPTREVWQRRPRPRTCYGCIPERPSVEDQGQRAGAAHRGPAEQQQRKQQQPVARLPRHGHAPPPRITPTKPTAARVLVLPRLGKPELAVPEPRPPSRSASAAGSLGARSGRLNSRETWPPPGDRGRCLCLLGSGGQRYRLS